MNEEILLVAINAKYIHSNLAVYSLKAALLECKNMVAIREYTINNMVDDIIDDIYRNKPSMIGFSCYIWNIEYVEKIIKEIHKLLPKCQIWLGGPEVSYNTEYYLDKYEFLTGIIVGEGEATFKEIVDVYKNNLHDAVIEDMYEGIAGICTHKKRDVVYRDCIDMSKIPFVYNDLKEFENRIIYYESSRGCPYSCSYCLSSIDKKIRFRDIELVKKELSFFLENKVNQVKFIDRTFNVDKKRSATIWKYIRDNDNGVTNFHFEISADLITDEEIEILSSMRKGLVQLEIGVQTTNAATITAIRRKMDLEKLKNVVYKLRTANNMHIHLDLIAGLPYEDINSFKNSFNEVYNMKPDELQLGFLKVLHGAYMYDDAVQYGIEYKSYPPYEVIRTKWMSYDDILSLKRTEEVLEIYYGTGQFVNSINYIMKFFETPYDFYKALGEYYAMNSKSGQKHSRIDRYNKLLDFAKSYDCDMNVLKQLLTVDVYLREDIKSRPTFAIDNSMYKERIKEIARSNETYSLCHIEPISVEVLRHIEELSIHAEKLTKKTIIFIAFDYSKRNVMNNNGLMDICGID